MSILAWRDALAVPCISRLFPADKRGDWPDCLTPGQAAALQRPYVAGDTQGRRQMDALALVIKEAMTFFRAMTAFGREIPIR